MKTIFNNRRNFTLYVLFAAATLSFAVLLLGRESMIGEVFSDLACYNEATDQELTLWAKRRTVIPAQ